MVLYPILGDNWTFLDNIFDRVSFEYNGWLYNGPVAANHHNAYVGMTTRLTPAAPTSTDPDLASLAYESGPLGSFYLPTSASELVDKGSRLAAEAGLYHFTSFTSNVKEGDELPNPKQVNIGPHYLALSNSNPVDSNNDGIPDFLADRNGNGVKDLDEMPWTTANIGTLAILSPLDSATVSGVVQVRSDLGADGSTAAYVEVLVDSSRARGSSEVREPGTSISSLEIDTTYLSNGPHQVQIRATYPQPLDGTGRDRVTSESSTIIVTVANDVNYPSWQNQAELAVKVAMNVPASLPEYGLWFFDSRYPVSYDPTPISYANGVASAGAISFSDSPANLGYGNSETDPDIYSVVELGLSGGPPAAAKANKNTQQNEDFPALGEWVVAYEDSAGDYWWNQSQWTPLTDPVDQIGTCYFRGHVLGGWIATAERSMSFESGALAVLPGGASQTWPVRETQGNSRFKADSKLLLGLLSDKDLGVRNFFGHGHGTLPSRVVPGVGSIPLGPARAFIGMEFSDLKRRIKNRRFRFVFLNGCATAGGDLLSAFGAADFELPHGFAGGPGGVPPPSADYYDGTPLDISAYSGNLRPAAFLGWDESPHYIETTVSGQKQFHRPHAFFVGQIASNWSIGQGWGPMRLADAIREARDDTLTIFGQSQGLPLNDFVQRGYRHLRCSEYQHAGDWP